MSDELPAAAEARMAEIRASGTWGSALTSDEFAAIRSVGFEPAGQVLGACVYNIGYTGGYSCPGAWGSMGYGTVMPVRMCKRPAIAWFFPSSHLQSIYGCSSCGRQRPQWAFSCAGQRRNSKRQKLRPGVMA